MKEQNVTLRWLLASLCADIDIFLLQNEDHTADNDQEFFTRDEIRAQLTASMEKFSEVLPKAGFDLDQDIMREVSIELFNN